MPLVETIETVRVALELFPRCVKCGELLDPNRIAQLVQVAGRPNRYAHRDCH